MLERGTPNSLMKQTGICVTIVTIRNAYYSDKQYRDLACSVVIMASCQSYGFRQDLSCTYLAHHELESNFIIIVDMSSAAGPH